MLIGPVTVQQGDAAVPPFSKVDNVSLTNLVYGAVSDDNYLQDVQSSGSDFSVPIKQSDPVCKQPLGYAPAPLPVYMDYDSFILPDEMLTAVPTKYTNDEYSQPMSMKYAELYSVPTPSKFPDLYTNGQYYDEAFFPVDTPNVIPNPIPMADFKQQALPENKSDNQNGNPELDYLFSEAGDLDLGSFLSLPAPANKEAGVSFNGDSDPFNLFGFQPSLEELDLLGSAVLDTNMPDDIHYWNGIQKDSSPKEAQAIADPVITSHPSHQDDNTASARSSPATFEQPFLPAQLEGFCDNLSPMSIPEDTTVPSNSPARSENWEKGLRDLFERTFDMSDIEGDYMLPPPNKRQEDNNRHWDFERKPHFSPLSPKKESSPSPHAPMKTPSPPLRKQPDDKHKSKTKGKPTLLFGKDEGEIIHKLLAANNKPITRDKLITIPVEEFNKLLDAAKLTEIEVAFMKEWRRRGKNKAAAQVARKRKREEVSGLDEEVEIMRQQKIELEKRYNQLQSIIKSLKERSTSAEDKLYKKQSETMMEPVSRDTHLIHVTDDDKLVLIPKISSKIIVVNS